MKIGQKIKELRLQANMSQEELGRRVGVQRAAIQKYEKGTVINVPINTIEKIAQIFDVSPDFIFGWNNSHSKLLSSKVNVLTGVHQFYGKDTVDLIERFIELSPSGKRRVIRYIQDIAPSSNL